MDAHGNVDVLSTVQWNNVLIRNYEKVEIVGANMNSLLKAVFILMANRSVAPSASFLAGEGNLPGGLDTWMDSIDHIVLCLVKLCKMDDILVRVETLFGNTLVAAGQRALSTATQNRSGDLLFLCSGALTFLHCLVTHFRTYLPSTDVAKIQFYATVVAKRCNDQAEFRPLRHTASELLAAATAPYSLPLHIEKSTVCLSCFQTSGQCQCRNKKSSALSVHTHRATALQVDLPLSVGAWDPHAVESATEKLKAQLTGRDTKFKLEIFGGDQFIDEISDEEDEDADEGGADEAFELEQRKLKKLLQPRIEEGVSLVEDPVQFSKKLLRMDLLELARQWTLVDHALFQSLSLGQILAIATSANHSVVHPHEFVAGGTKRFIERFNIASAWLTSHVLNTPTAEERAREICRLIELAEHFLTLHNFHGLMSALSALQQGSIVRLQITFDHVPPEYIDRLNALKVIMSGEKNQARYREELWKLIQKCPIDPSEWKQRFHGAPRSTAPAASAAPPAAALASELAIPAVVPHLGAHLAALMAIAECHGDYLTDYAHLFNLAKWKLSQNVVEPLARLQRLHYPFLPLRVVVAALHVAWKPFQQKGASGSNAAAKTFYTLSESVEPTAAIQRHFAAKKKAEQDAIAAAEQATATAAAMALVRGNRGGGQGGERGAVEASDEESDEESDEDDDEDDDEEDEPKKRKLLNPFLLLRPFLGRKKA